VETHAIVSIAGKFLGWKVSKPTRPEIRHFMRTVQ